MPGLKSVNGRMKGFTMARLRSGGSSFWVWLLVCWVSNMASRTDDWSGGETGALEEPIRLLAGTTPLDTVYEDSRWDRPRVIKDRQSAAKYFAPQQVENLVQKVDFSQQVVLLFAWRGSGQDRLKYEVRESYPEQVEFKYQPGRTRDLRSHSHVYVLRRNVAWQAGETVSDTAAEGDEYIRVEIKGRLNSQVMAIGAETTGVVVEASGAVLELELKDPQQRRAAEQLHEQQVLVTGRLQVRQGVEIQQRWIVTVDSLRSVNEDR